jgi:hypothetical protein
MVVDCDYQPMNEAYPSTTHIVASQRRVPNLFLGSTGTNIIHAFFARTSGSLAPFEFQLAERKSIISETQDQLTSTFGLVMDDLAAACRVTRKTLYNWRDHEEKINRRKSGMDRLFTLSIAARNWNNAGYGNPGDLLREPVIGGRSLFDLLEADELDLEAIQFVGARLAMRNLGAEGSSALLV